MTVSKLLEVKGSENYLNLVSVKLMCMLMYMTYPKTHF